jgi:hypothetical protein
MGVLVVSPDGQPVAVHIRGPQSLIHVMPAIPACLSRPHCQRRLLNRLNRAPCELDLLLPAEQLQQDKHPGRQSDRR